MICPRESCAKAVAVNNSTLNINLGKRKMKLGEMVVMIFSHGISDRLVFFRVCLLRLESLKRGQRARRLLRLAVALIKLRQPVMRFG